MRAVTASVANLASPGYACHLRLAFPLLPGLFWSNEDNSWRQRDPLSQRTPPTLHVHVQHLTTTPAGAQKQLFLGVPAKPRGRPLLAQRQARFQRQGKASRAT